MNELLEFKELLKNDELLYLETYNKITGWVGCASFYTNGEPKIYVNEGDGSGCDDAGYTFEEFMNKYDYVLKREIVNDEC